MKMRIVLGFWAANFLMIIVLTSAVGTIIGISEIPASNLSTIDCNNYAYKAFIGGIVSPVIEELIFRFPAKLSLRNFALWLPVGIITIASFVFNFSMLSPYCLLACCMYHLGLILTPNLRRVLHRTKRTSKFLTILTAILLSLLFAYSHYVSLGAEIFLNNLYLLLIPYFASGLVLSLVRLKYGLRYSIAVHLLHNTVIIGFSLAVLLQDC